MTPGDIDGKRAECYKMEFNSAASGPPYRPFRVQGRGAAANLVAVPRPRNEFRPTN